MKRPVRAVLFAAGAQAGARAPARRAHDQSMGRGTTVPPPPATGQRWPLVAPVDPASALGNAAAGRVA